jgi:membrane-bound serine protease (ClpP class)
MNITRLLFSLILVLSLGLLAGASVATATGEVTTDTGSSSSEGTVDAGSSAENKAPFDPGQGPILLLELDDRMINRGSKDYLLSGIERAEQDDEIRAVVIVIDTPGGVLDATRVLVKAMLASSKPIITYIAPVGSRGASAGVFITMAGHIAAMAPATHLGAAHPVFLGSSPSKPELPEEAQDEKAAPPLDSQAAMLEKVTEDTVSFARNIAEVRGRNADWAEKAVRDSVTLQVGDAVELNVVDLEANSLEELLAAVDGRVVTLADESQVVVRTKGEVIDAPLTLAQSVLYMLTDPTVAYLLLMGGLLGLGIEFRSPGLILPGVLGGCALLLALFSLSALPVNLVAVLFVVLGAGLILSDLFIPSHGLLSLGGVSFLAFGGIFLIDTSPEVPVGVSPAAVVGVCLIAGLVSALLAWLLVGDRKRKVHTASEGIVGQRGKVLKDIPGGGRDEGQILVVGERWKARSTNAIPAGNHVVVLAIEGLVLNVQIDPKTSTSQES